MIRPTALLATLALAACGGSSADANPVGECAADVHGCTVYADLTGDPAPTITFTSFSYSPKCVEVTAGQAVTFEGSFSTHPLQQTCGPVEAITAQSSGTSKTVTFTEPGTYGYECTLHFGAGMVGAIEVVP